MARKTYNVTQKVNIGGSAKSTSFTAKMEEADLPKLTALLAGGWRVTEVNEALTDMTKAETVETSVNAVSKINMSALDVDGDRIFESIKPFKGVIYLKNTVDSDALTSALSTVQPFKGSTAKPSSISATFIEKVESAE